MPTPLSTFRPDKDRDFNLRYEIDNAVPSYERATDAALAGEGLGAGSGAGACQHALCTTRHSSRPEPAPVSICWLWGSMI